MKRYLFIGSIKYSASCLNALLEMGIKFASVMCPYKRACAFNIDYADLGIVAKRYQQTAYYFDKINNEADYVKSQNL